MLSDLKNIFRLLNASLDWQHTNCSISLLFNIQLAFNFTLPLKGKIEGKRCPSTWTGQDSRSSSRTRWVATCEMFHLKGDRRLITKLVPIEFHFYINKITSNSRDDESTLRSPYLVFSDGRRAGFLNLQGRGTIPLASLPLIALQSLYLKQQQLICYTRKMLTSNCETFLIRKG